MVGFGAKKQVLIVGNDGVHLYIVSGKRVSLYADFSQSGGSLGTDLREAFKSVNAPLIILFDVVEQQYRRENIPKVGFMDKKKVIGRKLLMAFPQQQFRAFIPVEQKDKNGGATVALFAGLSTNLTITQILDAVLQSEVSIQGAGLLPMESTTLAKKLMEETHKRARTPNDTRWSVLMTLHATGGLRQIVIKDGELALTRLTPLAVDPNDTRGVVDEMSREFNATLTYLSRFGYIPSDGLDLIVVSSAEVAQLMRETNLAVSHLYPLSVHEAGKLVGLVPEIPGHDDIHGEILHAGWVGRQRKMVMPLSAAVLDRVAQTRQTAQAMIFLLIFGIGYIGWQAFGLQAAMLGLQSDITQQKAQRVALQSEYDAESKKWNTLKYDPEKTRVALLIHDEFKANSIDFEPTMRVLNETLDQAHMSLKEIDVTPFGGGDAAAGAAPVPMSDPSVGTPKQQATIKFTVSFNANTSIEEAARMTNDLAERLKQRLPGRQVAVSEIVGNLALDKAVQGTSEQVGPDKIEGRAVDNEVSTLTITGALE